MYRERKSKEQYRKLKLGRMKKNRENEPIRFTIHLHVKISQENSLDSYLYLKQAKMSFFKFFYFFFYKIGEQEGKTGGGHYSSGRQEVAGKGGGRVNTVQKMCTHACKCKNCTC
jgi:hypothetical protein